jgi:pimeloyl-ACP methyl ester carboxylesterase
MIRGYFHDTGNGPVGIYLHGFRSHCHGEKSLEIARNAQANQRSWIRFDMRGHGLSGGRLADQLISSSVKDILKIIDFVGKRPVVLHGSSMGGWVALIAAMQRQAQTLGLMLIAPAFNFIQNNFASQPAQLLQNWKTRGYMSFPDAYGEEPYTLSYRVIADARPYDVLDRPVRLNIPVHIVHGENDPIVPITVTEKFIQQAQITNLAFERIPEAEHRLTDQLPLLIGHIERLWQEIE